MRCGTNVQLNFIIQTKMKGGNLKRQNPQEHGNLQQIHKSKDNKQQGKKRETLELNTQDNMQLNWKKVYNIIYYGNK